MGEGDAEAADHDPEGDRGPQSIAAIGARSGGLGSVVGSHGQEVGVCEYYNINL